jgi:hypothetical protein
MEPNEEHPQGAAVLDATERWLRRFVHFPSEAHYTLATLWVAGSHMTDETGTVVHKAYGRLGFVSNEPASGKTTAMERALALTPRGEVLVQPSLAGIMDAIDERQIIALDEADKYFGRTGRMAHVTAFLNAGYKQGGGLVRHRGRKVDSFALVMYSGLLEALGVNPDLQPLRTRSFLIEMHAMTHGTTVEEYDDERHDAPQGILRQAVASWAHSVAHVASGVVVETPEGVTNRRAQIWRPLLRTAALAGGYWPDRAREACEELESGISSAALVLTPEQRIIADVLAVCEGVSRVPTPTLIEALHEVEGAPWKFVLPHKKGGAASSGTARELAALLEPHGLFPRPLRFEVPEVGMLRLHGYELTDHQECGMCTPVYEIIETVNSAGEIGDDLRPYTDQSAPYTDGTQTYTDDVDVYTDEQTHPDRDAQKTDPVTEPLQMVKRLPRPAIDPRDMFRFG